MLLVFLLVISLGYSYYWHHHAYKKHNLSSCPARLAAVGLDFNALSFDASTFVTTKDLTMSKYAVRRHTVYNQMSADLKQHGLKLGGVITQGLTQADLFELAPARFKWGKPYMRPKLQHLQVPVRAVVLPLLHHEAALQLHSAVRHALQQLLLEESVWYQDPTLMHATLYHASDYQDPIQANQDQVQAEAAAVAGVAGSSCPVQAVLDRLVITSTGVIVACWQVLPGSGEPAEIRMNLQKALPLAPPSEQQVVQEHAMLHTTVARLLAPALHPAAGHTTGDGASHPPQVWSEKLLQQALQDVMADLSDELCGLMADFDEVWYVEEQELLALALGGRFVRHASALHCPR